MKIDLRWTVLTLLLAGSTVFAQDFQKTYAVGAGGQIRIGNVSGNVTVTGYNGDSIVVTGTKVGRDRDRVEIVDNSAADRVEIKVRYTESHGGDASVNFDVRVPQGVKYNFEKLYSVSGNVRVSGVTGQVRADSVSGNVEVLDVVGLVSAGSVSGNVDVEIRTLDGSGDMKFSSVSGNVTVKAPANLDAFIEMQTLSGGLKTDFPIEVTEPRYGPGRSARGRVGAGNHSLGIRSVSGRIALLRF